MFYSPRKNIEAFIETKNEEIKTLKQKIMGSRVTQGDMQIAKSRLDSLRSSQIHLEREDHLELKEVLKASQQAVSDLVKKKNRLLEQFEVQRKESEEMGELERELADKKEKAEQFEREAIETRQKLLERKEAKQQQIEELQQEIELKRKELTMERDVSDELETAKIELKTKMTRVQKDLESIKEENERLKESVRKELEEITKFEHQEENESLRVENIQLKIEKEEKNCQNLLQKIDAAQVFMQRFSEDKLIYLKEAETESNINTLLKMCHESNEKKQREQLECQEDINELKRNIEKAMLKRDSLFTSLKGREESLQELKEKSTEVPILLFELKSILNSIFHQDSNIVKLLADKKVYDESHPEPTLKQKESQTSAASVSPLKQDMLDMMATSDNFFMNVQ